MLPPRPTEPGVTAEPSAGAVEAEENSSAAAIIQVEAPPVFAEEPVNINAAQLQSRCHNGDLKWVGPEGELVGEGRNSALGLDNDGNAFVVALGGESCAAGSARDRSEPRKRSVHDLDDRIQHPASAADAALVASRPRVGSVE